MKTRWTMTLASLFFAGALQAAPQAPVQSPVQANKATQAPAQAPMQKAAQAPLQAPMQKATQAPHQAPVQKPTQAPTQSPKQTAQADSGYRTYSYQPEGYSNYEYGSGYASGPYYNSRRNMGTNHDAGWKIRGQW